MASLPGHRIHHLFLVGVLPRSTDSMLSKASLECQGVEPSEFRLCNIMFKTFRQRISGRPQTRGWKKSFRGALSAGASAG